MLILSLFVAFGCGVGSTGDVRGSAGTGGGAGGFGGEAGAGGFGGEGTEEIRFPIPDIDCEFWDSACDPGYPGGMGFFADDPWGTVQLTAPWWVYLGEPWSGDKPARIPDRVEVCTRKHYDENHQVYKVVGACVDAEWDVIPDADGDHLLITVGSYPYAVEDVWWYTEIRLYFEP
jgi:hypothetical protein